MPPISPDRFLERLQEGKALPLILLLGADRYLRDLCRHRIVDAHVAEGTREWAVVRYSAGDDSIDAILGQAQTLPMLAPRQVILVSDVNRWERLGDDARDSVIADFIAYSENPAPFTVLVLEADALDQRMRLAKVLADKTLVVSAELASDPGERVKLAAPLALQMARERGLKLEGDAATELAESVNGDLEAVRSELEKLASYAGERKVITRADVELLVISARKYSVWELADMLAAQQVSRALEFLDGLLREGEQPAALLGTLAWMYRKLLEAREVPANAPDWQAASRLHMRTDTAARAVRQSRQFPPEQLTRGLAALYEADSRLKSGGTSQRAVLEFLVAQLAGTEPARRGLT